MTIPLTLLIVDDDEDDKEMFIEVAKEIDSSFNFLEASNGQEAIEILKKEENLPDFIFLDLNMPRMNGWQCLSYLKKDARFCSVPVIIYTTSKMAEDKEETKKSGSTYFITKPNSMNALKKELKIVFAEQGQPQLAKDNNR